MIDYTCNRANAQILVSKLQDWWKEKGHDVDVWADTIPIYNSNGDRVAVRFDIRSNIRMDVAQGLQGNMVG
jgi:hypothetical protein